MGQGQVIVIVSGKGGTGKTMFTANAGALLAMEGKKVALMDMDNGLRNLDLYLGLESHVVYNVMDVLSGMCRISQAMIRDKRLENLYLLAASPVQDERDITPLHMEILCDRLREEFDYILIDGPAGAGEGLTLAASPADRAVILTEAEVASMRDADVIYGELGEMGIEDRCCIINKVHSELVSTGVMPDFPTMAGDLAMDVAGVIQYDENLYLATNNGIPIVIKPGTYIEQNFKNILDRIL